jgi:Arc/MetJ family transcription regulator
MPCGATWRGSGRVASRLDIASRYRDIVATTVVDLRDDLSEHARRVTGLKRKVDMVNAALEAFVRSARGVPRPPPGA